MNTFMLVECLKCYKRYAAAPDPDHQGQWVFFEWHRIIGHPTHICVGGVLCENGHGLELTPEQAVFTGDGNWLVLRSPLAEPVWN